MEAKDLPDFIEDQRAGNTPSIPMGPPGPAGELDVSVALEALSLGPGVNPSLEASDIHCRCLHTFFHFLPHPAGVNMLNSHSVTQILYSSATD